MQNVKFEVVKDELVIRINLKERNGLSGSGKNEIIASTGGNVDIGKDGIKLGLNCYIKAGEKKK
jgi:hypothetical protein